MNKFVTICDWCITEIPDKYYQVKISNQSVKESVQSPIVIDVCLKCADAFDADIPKLYSNKGRRI